jgi:hypothetical protein
MTSSSDGRGGAVAFQAITNSSNSLPRRWRRTGATSASFIAAARLEDEPPQRSEVPTTIVKIRKTIPAKDRLVDPIPSPGQSSAKAGSESGTVPESVIPNLDCELLDNHHPTGPASSSAIFSTSASLARVFRRWRNPPGAVARRPLLQHHLKRGVEIDRDHRGALGKFTGAHDMLVE